MAGLLLLTSQTLAGSFTVPAWAFDRGNVRTFTAEWADAEPMVAFGGQSPIFVEYDLEFPAAGQYGLTIRYAAGEARPVALFVDGQAQGAVCRDANGSGTPAPPCGRTPRFWN